MSVNDYNKNPYKGFAILLSKKSKKFLKLFSLKQRISFIDSLDVLVAGS